MKDVIKLIGIFLTGLFIAAIGYPFLHESGHSIAAVCVGAKIEEFHLLPVPYVLCNVVSVNLLLQSIIGLSGMLFPLCLTMFKYKNFWLWYSSFIMKGICLLSFILSFTAVVCYNSDCNYQCSL